MSVDLRKVVMETLDTGLAVLAWLWWWGWRIFLFLAISFVVIVGIRGHRRRNLYRKYFGHPIDLLAVMSTERWDDISRLQSLLNAKAKDGVFKPRDALGVWLDPPSPFPFYEDIGWLLSKGFIEERQCWYDIHGNEAPEGTTALIRDDFGIVIAIDKDVIKEYAPRTEYRKTGKGGGGRKNKQENENKADIPHGALPAN